MKHQETPDKEGGQSKTAFLRCALISQLFTTNQLVFSLTYYSFVQLSYKFDLECPLLNSIYKIDNTWLCFHNNIKELINFLGTENVFPSRILDKIVVKLYLNKLLASNHTFTTIRHRETSILFYKLPQSLTFSGHGSTQN